LQFLAGDNADRLGLTGQETFTISELTGSLTDTVTVHAGPATFRASVRLDTPREAEYYRHGGIMPYVVRQMLRPR
jgi:aconitate hydratase